MVTLHMMLLACVVILAAGKNMNEIVCAVDSAMGLILCHIYKLFV
jgi:hypothetical protein